MVFSLRSTGSGAFGELPPGEPLEADSSRPPTEPVTPRMPVAAATGAATEAAAPKPQKEAAAAVAGPAAKTKQVCKCLHDNQLLSEPKSCVPATQLLIAHTASPSQRGFVCKASLANAVVRWEPYICSASIEHMHALNCTCSNSAE